MPAQTQVVSLTLFQRYFKTALAKLGLYIAPYQAGLAGSVKFGAEELEKIRCISANSWFTTVVDRTELGQVYPIQLKPLNYDDHKNKGATGAPIYIMTDFGIKKYIP